MERGGIRACKQNMRCEKRKKKRVRLTVTAGASLSMEGEKLKWLGEAAAETKPT